MAAPTIPLGNTDEFPINTAAVDLAWQSDDQNLWFVTAEGAIGRFEPRSPWSNTVFTPGPGFAGTANSLVAWPGHGVWTFLSGQSAAVFVKCDNNGHYQTHPLDSGRECHSMVLAKSREGWDRIVAVLSDRSRLVFINSGGVMSTSLTYPDGLHGVAVSEREPTRYWLSSPGGRSLVRYDAHTGAFSPAVTIGVEPRDLAVTPSGDTVWVATPDNEIYKYGVGDGLLTRVDSPCPARRQKATADGTLWFAGPEGDAIGYVLPGEARAAVISTGDGSRPSGLAMSADSRLWAALSGRQALRRVSRYRLAVVSGDAQSTVVGRRFADALVVKAVQLDGTPVAGQRIEFSVEGGSAVFENDKPAETRYTGTEGEQLGAATSSLLKALKEGPCVVTARWTETKAVASFSRLTVTPPVGAAHHVRYVSGAGQTVSPGKSFDEPMKVIVEDKDGSPVPGAEVTFKIRDEGAATFPGGVDTAKVTGEADGSATSPVLTAGDKADVFAVRVWVAKTPVSLLLEQNIQ
ncbi:hypothetical protein BLA24_33290 [Streptomyces cinnamoneus]|uniref:Big-1 domain-containing protein n=1 Tax=Streptomyces cinnamoneus TaxID=53446 RepID=A0A2G1XAP4_STRCJ|nr:hypothetical protein [Streptomyces cinnamoneus]PHQ48282.1 hypothetical protein BLA24_33290 [Streptomyces cinnamoneus]PPT15912.1 hypothetical protein CYQ11_26340 [Streptomyces cinnamoneus]